MTLDGDITIREATHDDLVAIAALNRAAVPAVNLLELPQVSRLVEWSSVTLVAEDGGMPVGFLISVGPGTAYDSLNYRFFADRYPNFQYVDRVVVDPEYQRQGIAAAFYDRVAEMAAQSGATLVAAEVNVRPSNPTSLAFHHAHGFETVGEQDTEDGAVRVRLMIRELP